MSRFLIPALVTAFVTLSHAHQAVQTGPPPEIRALIDGFVEAVNGDSGAWERYAQRFFAPAYLTSQTLEQRTALHRQMADRFGPIARGPVRREGPEAPLEITVKGAKASGVVTVFVDDTIFKITRIALDAPAAAERAATNGLPPIPVDGSMPSDEIDRRLDPYFAQLARDDRFSGAALVARNGVPVFLRAYGMADREKNIANTVRTRFNIGSINKAFTQIAVNQLIAEGKLSRTDTIGKFFPDYPQVTSRTATIEQLLNHRAGLADFFGPQFNAADKKGFASNADYFRFVSSLPPVFAPGERNQYCNGCYIALGAIVEKVSGMPYEKYVADKVFARAEMTSTGYPRTDQPAADIALGYTRRVGNGTLQRNTALHGVTGSAAGGGYSTVLDLLTFVKAVRAGRFPGASADMGIAGGAPGTNAVVESRGEWTVIVVSNFDPPTAEDLGNAIANALDARQSGLQPVQYRSAEGEEYRSLPDTDAVKTARAAHEADPKNIARIIDLGIAQSGARQFREAIATFTRGLEIEPDNALLLRWRGHRYLSVRDFDRAFADLSRGSEIDPTIYGNWYHLGVVQFVRGDFANAAASFAKALPIAPDSGELQGSVDWLWMSLSRAGRTAEATAMLDKKLDQQRPDLKPVTNAYTTRIKLYRGEIGPDAVLTPADTDPVQIATLAYGLGNWYLVRGDKEQARSWFERSVKASGGWPGFGFIVSEIELRRLR